MDELKKCPCCGGDTKMMYGWDGGVLIKCTVCSATSGVHTTIESLKKEWYTRYGDGSKNTIQ